MWLSLNIHLHMLFVDGVYTFEQERPRLHRGCAPAQPELQRLLRAIATRVTRALERQGLLIRDDETPSLDLEPDDGFEQLLGAAVHYRIATGPHAGRKALTRVCPLGLYSPAFRCFGASVRSRRGRNSFARRAGSFHLSGGSRCVTPGGFRCAAAFAHTAL